MPVTVDTIEAQIILGRDSLTPALRRIAQPAEATHAKLNALGRVPGFEKAANASSRLTAGLSSSGKAATALRAAMGGIGLNPAAAAQAEKLAASLAAATASMQKFNAAGAMGGGGLARHLREDTVAAAALSRALGSVDRAYAGSAAAAALSQTRRGNRAPRESEPASRGRGGAAAHLTTGHFTPGHLAKPGIGIGSYIGIGPGAALGIAAAFGLFEGIKFAAKEEQAQIFTMLAAGVDPTDEGARAVKAKLRVTAEKASLGTVFARADIAKLMPAIAGLSDVPLLESLPFMPGAIQFAEIEKQFGTAMGKNFESAGSASAAIRMAHLLGISDPGKMMPVLNMMVPASTTAEASPEHLVRVLQYMMGSAAGVGMSNQESINLGTLGAIMMPGTRAGTSLNMMLMGMIPKAGPGAGTKVHAGVAKRLSLLNKMGLVDKSGQLYRDAEGGMMIPLLEHLQTYQAAHPKEALGNYVNLFKQRGARIAFELGRNPKSADMARELNVRQEKFQAMGGITGVQAKQNEALSNQALRSWANLKTILDDLAEGTLPILTPAFKNLNYSLEGIRGFIDQHPVTAGATATVGAGAVGLLGIGMAARAATWAGAGLGSMARGAAALAGVKGLSTVGAGLWRLAGGIGAIVGAVELLKHVGETPRETADWARSFSAPGTEARAITNAWIERTMQEPSARGDGLYSQVFSTRPDLYSATRGLGIQDADLMARSTGVWYRALGGEPAVSGPRDIATEKPALLRSLGGGMKSQLDLGLIDERLLYLSMPQARFETRRTGPGSFYTQLPKLLANAAGGTGGMPAGSSLLGSGYGSSFDLAKVALGTPGSAYSYYADKALYGGEGEGGGSRFMRPGGALLPPGGAPAGEIDGAAIGAQIGAAAVAQLNGMVQGMQVSLSGETTLNGTVHIDAGAFGSMIGQLIARGLSHAANGGAASTGSRTDYSGGPTLMGPGGM